MLWVNLIMDSFASLALATEPPTAALLHRRPYPKTKPLLSKKMNKHILGQSCYQLVVLLVWTFLGEQIMGIPSGRKYDLTAAQRKEPNEHMTMIFNIFVWAQLFNEINCRKIHDELNVFAGITQNHVFLYVAVFQIVCQVLIVQYTGRFFSCAPLSGAQWGVSIALGAGALPVGLALRCLSSNYMPAWLAAVVDDDDDDGEAQRVPAKPSASSTTETIAVRAAPVK